MMKSEFENLAGREVTDEQYRAIETLYMSSNLEKTEFVKSMKPILKNIPQPEKKKDIKRMVVRDRSGYRKTPNGCYNHIEYVELVDIDIKTGKYIIKPLEEKDFEKLAKDGHDLNLDTWFDFDYEDCIDEKKKPIELIGGFESLHDCWTLRFAAQRYTTASNEQESNFFLQLELNGLGSIGINPISELRRNIRGYQTTGPLPTTADPYDYYE